MSEAQDQGTTESQEVEEQGQQQEETEVDSKKLMAELERLKSTNQRLLDESYQYKQKYNKTIEQQEMEKKKQLEDQENYRELYEIEKQRQEELKNQTFTLRQQALKKELHYNVAAKAGDAYDVQDVISVLPKNMIEIDEENNTVKGVEDAINFVREQKPYLFRSQARTNMSDSRPTTDQGKRELTKEEKDKQFRESLGSWIS